MQVVGRRTLTCDFSRSGSHYVDWLVCIYTYCHPFVFAVEHHFCSSRASFFCSLWQAAPRLSETCEKWLAPLICEGRLHFPLVTKGVLHRTKTESLSYITFSSHTILFTRFTSLVWFVTERGCKRNSYSLFGFRCPTSKTYLLTILYEYRLYKRLILWKQMEQSSLWKKRDTMKCSVRVLQF